MGNTRGIAGNHWECRGILAGTGNIAEESWGMPGNHEECRGIMGNSEEYARNSGESRGMSRNIGE